MSDGADRRARERVAPGGRLRGEVMVFQPMTLLDIGLSGAQIETPFPLRLDALHQFRLSLDGTSVVVQGRIAHGHVGELRDGLTVYRSGVEFVELSPHAAHVIAAFVGAHRPGAVDGEIV